MNLNATKEIFAIPGFFFIIAACAADENPATHPTGGRWLPVPARPGRFPRHECPGNLHRPEE